MFDKNIFSQRLMEQRKSRGLTQLTLGETVGVAKQTINMIEKGQRAASIEVLYALSDYFNVSIDYLVGRTDNPDVNK